MNIYHVSADSIAAEIGAAIVRAIQQDGYLEVRADENSAVYPMLRGIAHAQRQLAEQDVELRYAPVVARVDTQGRKITAVRLATEAENGKALVGEDPAATASLLEQVIEDFIERQEMAIDSEQLLERLLQHTSESPVLSGGDIDAAWYESDVGEETVGGTVVTPDQDRVDLLGEAVGLTYDDDEPLQIDEKMEERDENRWLLNPESAEEE